MILRLWLKKKILYDKISYNKSRVCNVIIVPHEIEFMRGHYSIVLINGHNSLCRL